MPSELREKPPEHEAQRSRPPSVQNLFARQLAQAAKPGGDIDLSRLQELVTASYAEMERARRSADRSLACTLEELAALSREREHAAGLLRIQKLQLEIALNNMRHGLVMFDAEGRAMIVSQRYIELYRLAPEAAKAGCTLRDLLAQRAANGSYAGDLDNINYGTTDRIFELPDGRSIRVINRFMEGGGWVSVHENVTEREQQQQSFRLLFENNPLPMLVFNVEGLCVLNVNDAALSHYGYTREQFLNLTALDLRPTAYRDDFQLRMKSLHEYRGGAEWVHQKSDGSTFIAHIYSRALRYQGKSARLVVVTNVTLRAQAEEERDRNRELLDRVIDNVSMTILVKDARTLQYVLVNKAAEEFWGVPREQVIGRTARELFDPKTADIIDANDRRLIESNVNFRVPDHEIRTPKRGVRLVTTNRIAIRNQSGDLQYLLGVVDDVTERKEVEDQLRQAQKMEAVGNLTGGLAHDFNNLLTVIMGNLDLLREDVAGNFAAEQEIDSILQASERGADLTRDMLAFSRRQPLQAEEVNVNALIGSATRLLAGTLGENIAVDVQAAAELPHALVDSSQLMTALLNIAINARDAMPRGGALTIATRLVELDGECTAYIPDVAPGSYATIEISDTGTGMPPDVVERIFEPFFTTKPTGKGTGLGLSMVYGFIKQSGGHIKVYSEVGRGTTFLLLLPLAHAAPRPLAAGALVSDAVPRAGNESVLAVEDNPDIRATVVGSCATSAIRFARRPMRRPPCKSLTAASRSTCCSPT